MHPVISASGHNHRISSVFHLPEFPPKNDLKLWSLRYASRLLMLLSLALPAPWLHAEAVADQPPGMEKEIKAIIAAQQHPYLKRSGFLNRAEDLENLYKIARYQPLWLGHGRSEKQIVDALALLAKASEHGLSAANYDAEMLQQKLPEALKLAPEAYNSIALYDTALSLSLLRFLHDVHYGRVNPQGINFNLKLRKKKLADLPTLIKDSLAQDTVSQLPLLVEPKLKQYQKLKQALAAYRRLAAESRPYKLTLTKTIHPGDKLPQIEELRQFLVAIGDLPEDKAEDNGKAQKTSLYTGEIVEGVKKFQYRHGLGAYGVIGKETAAALSVPLTQRAAQIELAMERLRWLPELPAGPSIIVNIPAFQLWAFNALGRVDADMLNMKVVVGKALKNQTPVLMAELRFIDFMPYWNIPYSILKTEVLPKLIKNPNYLAKEHIELVPNFGNEVKPVPFADNSIAQLKQGTLKARQRPGNKNALGKVKFIFPNQSDVYLHDTPANALFSKSRRDFSHGCVRVENPQQLAEFVLKGQEGWSKETIQTAMQTPKTQHVVLKKPVPVLFFYTTSFFDQHDSLMFYQDIYDQDPVLQGALEKPADLSDQLLFISNGPEPVQLVR
ncbi:L,D-transpeptidase family protein [Methylobacter sp. Wu1]|uniref:L,D-transpeptidase family protein n=1 Tax=Methylobacter sp. Wu1 TaxID=3119359 RepID=UPI002F92BAD2